MNPILYALGAGVLSTFNPCAYTLLPAILTRLLGARGVRDRYGLRVGSALAHGPGVSALSVASCGLSMGASLLGLTVLVAFGDTLFVRRARVLLRWFQPIEGLLLIGAAAYLLYINLGYLIFDYELSARIAIVTALGCLGIGVGSRWLGRTE